MKKGCVVFNASAGRGGAARLEALTGALRAAGLEFEMLAAESGGSGGALADEALSRSPEWVAVAGGDGTVGPVAARMLGGRVPLGVIPMGTYNNFARSLGIPTDLRAAAQVIAGGRRRCISVGELNGLPFFESVGVGFDAALFRLRREARHGAPRRMWAALRRAFWNRRRRLVLELDRAVDEAVREAGASLSSGRRWQGTGRVLPVRAHMVTVSNGPFYGMNFTVAPDQRLDDGLLTVTVFPHDSKAQLAWHFLSISFGRRACAPRTVVLRVERLRITGPRPVATHLDGRLHECWPLEIRCLPRVLDVFAPA